MGHAIHLLRLEHGHTARLLDVMEEEARALGAGRTADRELLRLVLEYFAGYPEACHHPKEELIIRHLATRAPHAVNGFDHLVEDHARMGARVAALLELMEHDDAGRDALSTGILHFCARYRAHMDEEETKLFPAALAAFDENDWAEIDFDLFDREDPLFDHALEDRFAALRATIAHRAGEDHQARVEREEARTVASLTDVDAFNARMRALGEAVVLVELEDGSHAVEVQGRVSARIPPCSPARAAWSAWFYWKGLGNDRQDGR